MTRDSFYAALNHAEQYRGSQSSTISNFALDPSALRPLVLPESACVLVNRDLCLQAVAAEFQNESAAALAAAATKHLQEAEQAKNSGNEHW